MDCINTENNSTLKEAVIKKLNEELGSDLASLNKCLAIKKRLEEEKEIIERSVSLLALNLKWLRYFYVTILLF